VKILPPGQIVDGLHVYTEGAGGPVVVLEAGLAASSLSWSLVQSRVAEFTTVVSYDRAGLGWSIAAPPRQTALDAAHALARLLSSTGHPGPFIMVGH
jgi:pimeloyl-ACP methyl ester carboxylesterase